MRVGGLLTNSPHDADYEFQFYERSACSGSPFKEPVNVSEFYLEYADWQGNTPYWAIVNGRFGDGTDLLMDMEGWSISIIDKGLGVQRQCCEIVEINSYEHFARRNGARVRPKLRFFMKVNPQKQDRN